MFTTILRNGDWGDGDSLGTWQMVFHGGGRARWEESSGPYVTNEQVQQCNPSKNRLSGASVEACGNSRYDYGPGPSLASDVLQDDRNSWKKRGNLGSVCFQNGELGFVVHIVMKMSQNLELVGKPDPWLLP